MDAVTPDPQDEAERAFEALREEVAALRRGVEMTYRQAQQNATAAPDYSLTLGKMEKTLQAIAERMQAMERKPALTLTPASFSAGIDAAARDAVSVVSLPFVAAADKLRSSVDDLKALAGNTRTRREQRKWLATAGVLGVMAGGFLWFILIAMLPSRAGDWLAALPLGGGPWRAGIALMQRDSPQSFDRMVRLYKVCGEEQIELCEAAMAVRTIEPGQQK